MPSTRIVTAAALAGALSFIAAPAYAHVALDETGVAGTNQILDFTIGHGCTGADTVRVEIHLPAEVTSARALPWEFGEGQVITNAAGVPVSVVWTKPTALMSDFELYTVSMRVRVPDMPFTTLAFPTIQTCRAADGTETVVNWDALPGAPTGEPAPLLVILPRHYAGWNRFTVPASFTDLGVFADAEIVWQGTAAYSASPTTMALISAEPGVTVLTSLEPGSDVWVRY